MIIGCRGAGRATLYTLLKYFYGEGADVRRALGAKHSPSPDFSVHRYACRTSMEPRYFAEHLDRLLANSRRRAALQKAVQIGNERL